MKKFFSSFRVLAVCMASTALARVAQLLRSESTNIDLVKSPAAAQHRFDTIHAVAITHPASQPLFIVKLFAAGNTLRIGAMTMFKRLASGDHGSTETLRMAH